MRLSSHILRVDSLAAVAFPRWNVFFLLFFRFKTIENSNRQMRRLCQDAANEFIRLISLINSYLTFSLFHFFHDNVFAIRCICLVRGSCGPSNEAHTVCLWGFFLFLKKNGFFCCRCAAIYPTPGTCLVTATTEIGRKETNTSLPIFHTRHKIETVCFNPLLIP